MNLYLASDLNRTAALETAEEVTVIRRAEFAGDKSATHVSLVFALPPWANSVSVETASPSASVGGDRDKIQPAGTNHHP